MKSVTRDVRKEYTAVPLPPPPPPPLFPPRSGKPENGSVNQYPAFTHNYDDRRGNQGCHVHLDTKGRNSSVDTDNSALGSLYCVTHHRDNSPRSRPLGLILVVVVFCGYCCFVAIVAVVWNQVF